jgi:hypothetical protein
MNTIKESKMKITATSLIRSSGLAVMGTGIIFMIIQAIHPPDVLSSVTTARWATTHYLGIVMGILGLFGITGLYTRQVEETGWLGLVSYLLFGLFWIITVFFQFVEAFISPLLATQAPTFVEGFLGIVSGHAGEADLGALPTVYALTGFAGYMLGGLLFGLAMLRAGILLRWAAGLLALAAVSPLAAGLLSHPLDRILAVPMGVALISLGYALWSERRGQASTAMPGTASLQFRHIGAK